ncbi:MAG: glycosyltransferase [candidate division WOR-3 bacterium]|nr:MAG: glycosyltransferase [candidate division WOR-3 bacterium]
MKRSLNDYRKIVGDEAIGKIYHKARKVYGKTVVHVNSTYYGGGVAEILSGLVPLMNDIGIAAGWRMLRGTPDFFDITKKFHNALQGNSINLSEMKKKLYVQANEDFSTYSHITHNCVIIHDPQPLPLIQYYPRKQPWVWRIHIDLSNPNEELWEFLKNFILKYDIIVISSDDYRLKDTPVDQRVIHPAIDPLSAKNMHIPEKVVAKYLKKFNIPTDKPIITQISRFDKFKDQEGLIDIFRMVKEHVDCRLVLCGSSALDDPESQQYYERTKRKANNFIKDRDVIMITSENNILVNALQRKSDVIVQKSLREGFGLTVTEALLKEKPVIASKVGGITLQIQDQENGFLLEPTDKEGFARRIVEVLKDPSLAKSLGVKAGATAKEKFLITRLLADYLDLLGDLIG